MSDTRHVHTTDQVQIRYPASIKVRTHATLEAAGGKGRILETDIHYKVFVQGSFCLRICDHMSGDHFVPCGHDIIPPVLRSPKLYLASSVTAVLAVDKTPILQYYALHWERLSKPPFNALVCLQNFSPPSRGGSWTRTARHSPALTSLVFFAGHVLPPTDTAFYAVRL